MKVRPDERLASAALAAACVASHAPALLGLAPWYRDQMLYTGPLKMLLRARLLRGELPLWNPFVAGGRPFFAMVQPAVLDPVNAVLLAAPQRLAYGLYGLAFQLVAAFGVQRWLRTRGLDAVTASAGGALLALSGYLVSMDATTGAYAFGVAWVGWALHHLARSARAGDTLTRAGRVALAALCVALGIVAGDPMAAWFIAFAGLAQALGEPTRAARLGAAVDLAAALVGGALVAAVQLLPALEVARAVRGGGVDFTHASRWSFPPERLPELVAPNLYGTPYAPDWFVHELYHRARPVPAEPFANGVYLGLPTVPLALLALTRRDRRRDDVVLGVLALGALLLALGLHTPLWRAFYAVVPGAKMFRYPEKYLFVVTLALAALAARGLGVAAQRPATLARIALGLAVTLGVAALATQLFGASWPVAMTGSLHGVAPALAHHAVVRALGVAAALATAYALVAGLLHRLRSAPSTVATVLALLLGADLLVAAHPLLPWAPSSVLEDAPPLGAEALRIARERGLAPRVLRRIDERLLPSEQASAGSIAATLQPDVGMAAGLVHLDAYDALTTPAELRARRRLVQFPLRYMRLGATPFFVAPSSVVAREAPSATVVAAQGRWVLAMDPSPAPRAFIARTAVVANTQEESVDAVLAAGFEAGRDAVVEGGAARSAEGSCALTHDEDARVTLRCEASTPAWAVLSDRWFPGWTATVNGRPAALRRADVLFRAVEVPAGPSVVEFRYAPWGLRAGAGVSAAALLAACAAVLRGARKRLSRG